MPYTKLTSFQFERGKGFTEESVLTFRVLALNVIDELMRHEAPGASVANFSLTPEEVRLILEHRRVAYGQTGPTDAHPNTHDESTTELPPPTSPLRQTATAADATAADTATTAATAAATEAAAAATAATGTAADATGSIATAESAERTEGTDVVAAAHENEPDSQPAAESADDEFAAAARWLALATRSAHSTN